MTRRALAYVIAAGAFLLDRVTKVAIDRLVPLWDTRVVIPGFFNIVHTENAAAAFSLFAGIASGWRRFFLIGSSATAAVLLSVLLWRDGTRAVGSRKLSAGLALILGGVALILLSASRFIRTRRLLAADETHPAGSLRVEFALLMATLLFVAAFSVYAAIG